MEDEFIQCEHCQHQIPSNEYQIHITSDCPGLFCKHAPCKQKILVKEFSQHLQFACPEAEKIIYCHYCECKFAGGFLPGESTKVKDAPDHYLNDCVKFMTLLKREEFLRKAKRCPVCMQYAIERKTESQPRCEFCDPILVRSQSDLKGVPLHQALELMKENDIDDTPYFKRTLQGGRPESKRRKF
jgi:hypothetical protein